MATETNPDIVRAALDAFRQLEKAASAKAPDKPPAERPVQWITSLRAMELESWGIDWRKEGMKIEPEPYQGNNRVKFDVRLGERQIPEAMSEESKVFKQMIQRGLEKELLRKLSATSGMGLLAEDWEVLRQSLIEMINEQARLYYRQDKDESRNSLASYATVTFEIPKMTMSFRMPVDSADRF